MKPIVLYSSKSGNTERIAGEIASELSCRCEKIDGTYDSTIIDLDNFDPVFLGTGVYGGNPTAELLNYLKDMQLENSLHFALFMTWFGRGTTDKDAYNTVKAAVEAKGQSLLENCYSCLFERFSIITRFVFPDSIGHPTTDDLSNARKWARDIAKSI